MKSSHLALYIRIACGFHQNWLNSLSANNKRSLLSEVFVISGKIKVLSASVFGSANKRPTEFDYSGYLKKTNIIIVLLCISNDKHTIAQNKH